MSNDDLARTLEDHRFRRRIADAAFIERTRVIPTYTSSRRCRWTLCWQALASRISSSPARIVEVEGTRVRITSPQDLEDIRSILRASGQGLDHGYVESTLTMLEQALSQSDLLPAWRTAREG
jgi:hypothetical protein